MTDVKTVDVPSADTPNPYFQSQTTSFGQPSQVTQNNLSANDSINPIQNTITDGITQAANTFNVLSPTTAMRRAVDEYYKLRPLDMYDKYKHATVSCTGAQGGLLSAGATALGGLEKEAVDIIKKSYNLYQGVGPYKTYPEIAKDSLRDMQANINGLAQGITHPTANCEDLMKQYYNPYNK